MAHVFSKGEVIDVKAPQGSFIESFQVTVVSLLKDEQGNPGYKIQTPRGNSFNVSEERLLNLRYSRKWEVVE